MRFNSSIRFVTSTRMNDVIERFKALHLHTQDGDDSHRVESCVGYAEILPPDVSRSLGVSSKQRDSSRPIDRIAVDKRSHVCPQCRRSFRKRAHLRRHLEGIHSVGGPVFECRDGHYRTPRKDNYQRHLGSCIWKNFSNGLFICRCGRGTKREKEHLDHLSACTYRQKRRRKTQRS